eukprot:g41016.t1
MYAFQTIIACLTSSPVGKSACSVIDPVVLGGCPVCFGQLRGKLAYIQLQRQVGGGRWVTELGERRMIDIRLLTSNEKILELAEEDQASSCADGRTGMNNQT